MNHQISLQILLQLIQSDWSLVFDLNTTESYLVDHSELMSDVKNLLNSITSSGVMESYVLINDLCNLFNTHRSNIEQTKVNSEFLIPLNTAKSYIDDPFELISDKCLN